MNRMSCQKNFNLMTLKSQTFVYVTKWKLFLSQSNSMQCKAISISIERNGYYNEKHVHIYGISGILQHSVTTRSSDDQRRCYVVVCLLLVAFFAS